MKNLNKHSHLTQKQIVTIKEMIAANIFVGGTKYINYKITKISEIYEIIIYRYYALASVNFDLRPESKIPQWHFEQKTTIEL